LSKFQTLEKDTHISIFEGLSLSNYADARSYVCKARHKQPCQLCLSMIKVAQKILHEGFLKLKDAFTMTSPGVSYTSLHARRKLLQMPLVSIGVGDQKNGNYCVYLVEKQSTVHYKVLRSLLNSLIQSQSGQKPVNLSKETVNSLLKLAESDAEKLRLKYAIVKAAGLSSSKAKNVYGFSDMSSKVSRVENALEEATCIREAIENIAKVKDEAIARSLGIYVATTESSSSDSSETDSDCSEDEYRVPSKTGTLSNIVVSAEVAETRSCLNDQQLIDVLCSCDFNWIEFVRIICNILHKESLDEIETLLDRFAQNLRNLNVNEDNQNLVNQSRQAYAIQRRQKEKEDDVDTGLVLSESDIEDPDTLCRVQDPLDELGKAVIMKKRASIQRKAKREIKKRIAERRFLRKRRSKKIGKIQTECPDIGNTIEEFVRKRGVGADSWRRTGVLTFDGNRRLGKKVTFSSIQAHLQAKYKRKFSYGTVVQLCVPRNKRRKSAARYKGLAQVTQRRARKGFTLRYNPDDHWSAALYNGLDDIQYKDGTHIMNAGRDDQAGFRLDTMTTSKQHGTLCLNYNLPLTTRTDYTNPYPSVLQTTCYNFPATCTTGEVCAGVVKAKPLFNKNPAQHFADMLMLQEKEEIKPVFTNCQTEKDKEIECIRVDGGADEGPVHEEVQYWWTKRHFIKGTKATMVSTRSSGSSFKNRVELQNGCLALGHANLFIPSTLNGSCMESGKVNEEILCRNLDAAIDVYISRVDKAPCARTEIHLMKGANGEDSQKEREILLIFLKGTKEAKEKARLKEPDLYNEIEKIWQLRSRHLVQGLPIQYVFYLKCCYERDCIHSACKAEVYDKNSDVWYPGGPSLDYFPSPTPDPERPYGNESCGECVGFCAGHYLKPSKLLSVFHSGKRLPDAVPPSQVLAKVFKDSVGFPTDELINATAKKVLLKPENVRIWFQHLQTVEANRKKGAKKAAATRKAKARDKVTRKKTDGEVLRDSDDDEVCNCCYSFNPPDGIDQNVDWVACDTCALWYHACCVEFENTSNIWSCNSCMQ
jgi:hypothetical protein